MPAVAVRNDRAVATWHKTGSQVRVANYSSGSGWSAPQTVGSGTFPDVAISSTGKALVLFASGTTLKASVRSGGAWSAEQTIGSGTAHDFAVAIDGSGNGVAVWSGGGQVRARVHEGGTWGSETVLRNEAAVGRPHVAANDAGVVFAAWCDADGRMWSSRRAPSGAWGSLGGSVTDCCQAPFLDTPGPAVSVGVSATGEGVVVGGTATRVCQRRYVPGEGWHLTLVLASSGAMAAAPSIAVNADGRAIAAWRGTAAGSPLKVRAYVPGDGWGPLLTGPNLGTGRPGVAITSSGDGAIVYRAGLDIAAVVYSEGELSGPVDVGTEPGTAYYLRVGYDPTSPSEGISIWQRAGVGGEDILAARIGL
jgi:hypothetical protein